MLLVTFHGGAKSTSNVLCCEVVAQVNLTSNGQVGSLRTGCQSAYLVKLFPPPAVFLDGTFAGSQRGNLHGVHVAATPVPAINRGLGVMPEAGKVKNTVRDVAIANGIHLSLYNRGLFVSAGPQLYWSQLPSEAATVYIPFQAGTGVAVGGSIYTYTVPQGSPSTLPVLSEANEFVSSGSSTFQDTPEFVLYVAD